MRDEDDGRLLSPRSPSSASKQRSRRRVQGRQRVIQQTEPGRRVDAARRPSASPAAQRDAALADLRGVAGRQLRDVLVELRGRQGLLVAPRVEALGREAVTPGDDAARGRCAASATRARSKRTVVPSNAAASPRMPSISVDLPLPTGPTTQHTRPAAARVQAARTRDERPFGVANAPRSTPAPHPLGLVVALRLLAIVLVTIPTKCSMRWKLSMACASCLAASRAC